MFRDTSTLNMEAAIPCDTLRNCARWNVSDISTDSATNIQERPNGLHQVTFL